MAAVGFAWFATGVSASDDDVVHTAGIALDALFVALAVHLLLAFPTGELRSRGERLIVGTGYAVATLLQLPSLLFEERAPGDPRDLLVIRARPGSLRPPRRHAVRDRGDPVRRGRRDPRPPLARGDAAASAA